MSSKDKHGITSFRNSFNDIMKKLPLLLEGKEEEIWGSPEKNFFSSVKAIGLRREKFLTPIGDYLKNIFQKEKNMNNIINILRIQIIYYLTEKDFKMPFLDILSFLKDNSQANLENIVTFLEFEGYQLGDNAKMTIRSYIMSLLIGSGYVDTENSVYFIPNEKVIFVEKLLASHLYRLYKANRINKDFFYRVYEKYYLSDNIIDKILFFRYGMYEI